MTRQPTPHEVAYFVAESVGLPPLEVLTSSREPGAAEARWASITLLSELAKCSISAAASRLGLDRTIVRYYASAASKERRQLHRRISARAKARIAEHVASCPPAHAYADVRPCTPGPPRCVRRPEDNAPEILDAVSRASGIDAESFMQRNYGELVRDRASNIARLAVVRVAMTRYGIGGAHAARIAGYRSHAAAYAIPSCEESVRDLARRAIQLIDGQMEAA